MLLDPGPASGARGPTLGSNSIPASELLDALNKLLEAQTAIGKRVDQFRRSSKKEFADVSKQILSKSKASKKAIERFADNVKQDVNNLREYIQDRKDIEWSMTNEFKNLKILFNASDERQNKSFRNLSEAMDLFFSGTNGVVDESFQKLEESLETINKNLVQAAECDSLNEKIDSVVKAKERLDAENKNLQEEFTKKVRELEEQLAEMKKQNKDRGELEMKKVLAEETERIAQRAKLKELTDENNNLQSKVDQCATLREELALVQGKLAKSIEELENERLSKKPSFKDSAKSMVNLLIGDESQTREKIKNLRKENKKLKSDFQTLEQSNRSMMTELENLKQKNKEFLNKIQNQDQTIQKQEEFLELCEEREKQCESLEKFATQLKDDNRRLENEIEECDQGISIIQELQKREQKSEQKTEPVPETLGKPPSSFRNNNAVMSYVSQCVKHFTDPNTNPFVRLSKEQYEQFKANASKEYVQRYDACLAKLDNMENASELERKLARQRKLIDDSESTSGSLQLT